MGRGGGGGAQHYEKIDFEKHRFALSKQDFQPYLYCPYLFFTSLSIKAALGQVLLTTIILTMSCFAIFSVFTRRFQIASTNFGK